MTVLIALALAASPAHAGSCDSLIKRADSVAPAGIPAAFANAAKCSSDEAGDNFARFMTRATDPEILVSLSLAAIDADVWNPVWTMPGKISDYGVRDEITREVGAACNEHEKVVTFLQGAYLGLRSLDFGQWDDAFLSCESPDIDSWLSAKIAEPPKNSFDEKYDKLMGIYVRKLGPAALPGLKAAAVAAGESGPFESILIKMDEAVAPKLGQKLTDENRASLEAALVEIAQGVSPELARLVGDRLAAAGADDSAAKLLPVVFGDRQSGGAFTWGGLAIERADCKGVKTAVLHASEIAEPGKRWIVNDDAVSRLSGFKAKLKKCTVEEGDWPVVISPEPLVSGGLDAWARSVGAEWAGNGYEVEVKKEAGISLP